MPAHSIRSLALIAAFASSGALACPGSCDSVRAMHVPTDQVPPPGLCRVWHREMPPERQARPMSCARAHWIASEQGGHVIRAVGPLSYETGAVAATAYGRGSLAGVLPGRVNPP